MACLVSLPHISRAVSVSALFITLQLVSVYSSIRFLVASLYFSAVSFSFSFSMFRLSGIGIFHPGLQVLICICFGRWSEAEFWHHWSRSSLASIVLPRPNSPHVPFTNFSSSFIPTVELWLPPIISHSSTLVVFRCSSSSHRYRSNFLVCSSCPVDSSRST